MGLSASCEDELQCLEGDISQQPSEAPALSHMGGRWLVWARDSQTKQDHEREGTSVPQQGGH